MRENNKRPTPLSRPSREMGIACCCECCLVPRDAPSPDQASPHTPEIKKKYFSDNNHSYSTADGDVHHWIKELEQLLDVSTICTESNWESVWPDIDSSRNEFDKAHIAKALVMGDGKVKVVVPARRGTRAGVASRYIRFLALRDETSRIRALVKFNFDDIALPWTFRARELTGARELTPVLVDSEYGLWEGKTIQYEQLDPRNFSRVL